MFGAGLRPEESTSFRSNSRGLRKSTFQSDRFSFTQKTLITELAKQKVQAVVLGCTELVLAVDTRANVLPVYDTTAIHARAAVAWMLTEEEQARAAA